MVSFEALTRIVCQVPTSRCVILEVRRAFSLPWVSRNTDCTKRFGSSPRSSSQNIGSDRSAPILLNSRFSVSLSDWPVLLGEDHTACEIASAVDLPTPLSGENTENIN